MVNKKEVFKKKSAREIMKDKEMVKTTERLHLYEQIGRMTEDKFLAFFTNIIPRKYYPGSRFDKKFYERRLVNAKFLKHGSEVKVKRAYSLEEIMKEQKRPFDEIRKAAGELAKKYDSAQFYSGYTMRPATRTGNSVPRKFSLVQNFKGAKLYAYSELYANGIDIEEYGTIERAQKAETEGSIFVVNVPSRTGNKARYEFSMENIATVQSPYKFAVANTLDSDHTCNYLRYKNIRYKYRESKESSRIKNICVHEVAGNIKIMEYSKKEDNNLIPWEMSWILIPTQFTVDAINHAANHAVVAYENAKGGTSFSPLTDGELEIYLWNMTHSETKKDGKKGFNRCWLPRKKLVNYKF